MWKMTYKDKGSYESSPPCTCIQTKSVQLTRHDTIIYIEYEKQLYKMNMHLPVHVCLINMYLEKIHAIDMPLYPYM